MFLKRRDLLRNLAVLGAGMAIGRAFDSSARSPAGEVQRRPLGHTGVEVSVLALGGAHLGEAKTLQEAAHIVHEAIDAGLTFMDNAWEYNDGRSEEWMGKALEGRREKAF